MKQFEDLGWVDVWDPQRSTFVAHIPDRKILKWAVFEEQPSSGPVSLSNHASLRQAIFEAMVSAHWFTP
jgi:hypothetical protein